MPRRSPIGAPLAGLAALVAVPLALGACATGPSHATMSPESTRIATIVEQQMQELSLRAVIVEVGVGDELVLSRAWGESMTGVPATTDMHFRNGAVAFAYVSNLLMQYVDAGAVALDDTIDEWFPELPAADVVMLRMLANQTSGYPDFEKDPAWNAAYNDDPFQEFGFQERLDTAFSKPLQFEPGTNWSYSHTNFMILGEILAAVGDAPLDELLAAKVLGPLGLTGTSAHDSAFIPEPVLHAYTSERRVALGIPAGVAFMEESTYWNPVWGTPTGAAQTTTIGDLTRTAVAIGTGRLLSDESYHAMTDSTLIGFGERLPSCAPSCFTQVEGYNYGLGVVRSGSWILQNPQLSGYSAVMAYLPAERISIAVAATYAPGAFDADGGYQNASDRIFREIGAAVADDAPPMPR